MKHIIIIILSFFPASLKAQETVIDIDGNIYRTINIGNQKWMAENLKVTHYNDSTIIPLEIDNYKWSKLITGAYCISEKNTKNYIDTYGLLYNYSAVINSRKLCPMGWHVPTALEWETLIDYLGGDKIAGKQMKKTDSNLWEGTIKNINNNSGFSAIPAGGRGRSGGVGEIGIYATWWSSTSEDSDYAWHWGLYPDNNKIRFNPGHKKSGFSVRCIKDN